MLLTTVRENSLLTRSTAWSDMLTSAPLAALYAAVAGVIVLTLYRLTTSDR